MKLISITAFPFFSCLLLLCACSAPEEEVASDGWKPLRVASITVDASATPRSIIEEVGTEPGRLSGIGVYALYADNTEYKPAHGSNTGIYMYDGSQWAAAATQQNAVLRLPTGTEAPQMKASAWHPSGLAPVYMPSGGSHVTGVTVPSVMTFDAADQEDYLYAAPVKVTAGTAVSFAMNHAQLKLTCKVYKSASLTEEIHLTGVTVTERNNNWLTGQGSMRLADGVFTGLTNTSKLVLKAAEGDRTKTVPADRENPVSVHCLVAPTSVSSFRFELEAESSAQKYSFQSSYVTPSKTEGAKGDHIIVTIKLDGMDARVTGIGVYKWESYSDTYIPVTPEPEAANSVPTRCRGGMLPPECIHKYTIRSVSGRIQSAPTVDGNAVSPLPDRNSPFSNINI